MKKISIIVISTFLFTVLSTTLFGRFISIRNAKYESAMKDMKKIARVLRPFADKKSKLTSITELRKKYDIKCPRFDPWKRNYIYKSDGQTWYIATAGSDRKFKGFNQKGTYNNGNGQDIIFKNGEPIYYFKKDKHTPLATSVKEGKPGKQAKKENARFLKKYKLKESFDRTKGVKWYMPKTLGKFQVSIGIKNDYVFLKLKIITHFKERHFLKNVSFLIDGRQFSYSPPGGFDVDVLGKGRVREYCDVTVEQTCYDLLIKLGKASVVKVRLKGEKGDDEFTLKPKQLKQIRIVIEAYKELGGLL